MLDFQCLGMTVLAAVKKCFKSPFFKDDIGPGSIVRRPNAGEAVILEPVRELYKAKIHSQKGSSIGQSHHICSIVPGEALQRQQQSDVEGYILCNKVG